MCIIYLGTAPHQLPKAEHVCQSQELYYILSSYYCHFHPRNAFEFHPSALGLNVPANYLNNGSYLEDFLIAATGTSFLLINNTWNNTGNVIKDPFSCLYVFVALLLYCRNKENSLMSGDDAFATSILSYIYICLVVQ